MTRPAGGRSRRRAGQAHIRVSVKRAVSAGGHVQPPRRHSKGGAQSASALKPAVQRAKRGAANADLSDRLSLTARATQSGRPAAAEQPARSPRLR